MDKTEFEYRLIESTRELIEFTQTMVTNSISKNVEYLIEPSSRLASNHLNERELFKLEQINLSKGKPQSIQQTIDLLYDFGLTPLWINAEISHSFKKRTLINLTCSRRFRKEEQLNKKVDKFPPFHIGVSLPPWHKKGEKFNINWKRHRLKLKLYSLIWKYKYRKRLKNKKPN
ncbi:hypothetical protein [Winogradskyella sp.]|uniref:hypothetical protein n=1 Tax=unclassified Winogradskyella TaxID=2615021 RepID=UPI001B2AC537|nr:hypothetical protein [Winogradskyella sp.]MBO6880861.1 hypothetical protein [Winogradskyella sp.]